MAISTSLRLGRNDWWAVAGMGLLWFSLMVSPYYPASLSPLVGDGPLDVIATLHGLYSLALIVAYGLIVGFRKTLTEKRPLWLRRVAGAAGTLGCLVFLFAPAGGYPTLLVDIAGLVLVAFSTAFFFVAWLALCTQQGQQRAPLLIGASFVAFSAVWVVLILVGNGALTVLSALAPVLSLIALERCGSPVAETPVSASPASLRPLPWGVIVLLVTFIYFGTFSVRLFTTMGSGVQNVGTLQPVAQGITALSGLVIVGAFTVLFARKQPTTSNIVSVGAALALVYLGCLLVIVLADPQSSWMLGAKRLLVGTEHSAEVLLLVCLASKAARRHLSCPLLFGLAGIVAFTVPQLVSQDLMLALGALPSLSESPALAPLAALGAFLITAAAVALLITYSRKTVAQASIQGDAWQADLCRRATASYDITPRELEVVTLSYRGYSAKKIAETLLVSESTVKAHLSHIYRRLSVHNKQELIALIDTYRHS